MSTEHFQLLFPWIAGLAVVVLSLVLGTLSLLKPAWSRWIGTRVGAGLLSLAMLNVAGHFLLANWQSQLPTWMPFVVQMSVMVLGGLIVIHALSFLRTRAAVLPSGLLAGGGLCLALLLANVRDQTEEEWKEELASTARTQLDAVTRCRALTDHGTPIQLFNRQHADRLAASYEEKLAERLVRRVIETGPIDLNYNCHGWTFTGGEYIVLGEDVPRILCDNGYEGVIHPRVGDVIVYYEPSTQSVVHTGVVRAAGSDGLIMIESKWGDLGVRYLHQPQVQPYSTAFNYFRSTRPGHLLAGLAQTKSESTDDAVLGVGDEDEPALGPVFVGENSQRSDRRKTRKTTE